MTSNPTLSIPAALLTARPDDYYRNAATIDWPDGANGQPLVLVRRCYPMPSSSRPAKTLPSPATSSASWPRKAGSPIGSTSPATMATADARSLVEQPFWLDPSDPHRMRAAIQILTRRHHYPGEGVSGELAVRAG